MNALRRPPRLRRFAAFTLLEMVVAMFILALLVGGVFAIVRGVTQLAGDMAVARQRDARLHGFVELCSRTFRNLPSHGVVQLRASQIGGRYLTTVMFLGAASPLAGGDGSVTVLETEEAPDGYLRVVLRLMSPAQALAWEKGDAKAGTRLVLMENIATLDWQFCDSENGRWVSLWNERLRIEDWDPALTAASVNAAISPSSVRRPGVIELKLALDGQTPQRFVLWTPPAEP